MRRHTTSASPEEPGEPGQWSFEIEAVGRTPPTPMTWVWDFRDGQTAKGVTQNHVYAAGGSHKIVVTAKKSDGSVEFTLTLNITVKIPPIPDQPQPTPRPPHPPPPRLHLRRGLQRRTTLHRRGNLRQRILPDGHRALSGAAVQRGG